MDTATLELLLGVGRRRAQQILATCITERLGANGLAHRMALIAHLRGLSEGGDGYCEQRRPAHGYHWRPHVGWCHLRELHEPRGTPGAQGPSNGYSFVMRLRQTG